MERSIYEEIVGSSTSLQKVLAAIDKVARTDSTVLVTGETGTGKELVVHAIHRRSPRSARALVKVNCAALPSELIASELFGHEKGAFVLGGCFRKRSSSVLEETGPFAPMCVLLPRQTETSTQEVCTRPISYGSLLPIERFSCAHAPLARPAG